MPAARPLTLLSSAVLSTGLLALGLGGCASSDASVESASAGTPSASAAEQARAIESYRDFVQTRAEQSAPTVDAFVAAVKDGNVSRAKALYAASRYGWEAIEPVAEAFGDLDPAMDLRQQDVEAGAEWTGWHRIESALWRDSSTAGLSTTADLLLADYRELLTRIPTADLSIEGIGNGAKELMDEVATGKVTGEEEAFSHTDLVDFDANVEGARAAFSALRPLIVDGELVQRLDDAFKALDEELALYGSGTSYRRYDALSRAQIDGLVAKVDALAEPLSGLAAAASIPPA